MGVEIEKKFLVRSDGWRRHVTRSSAMRQGYLVAEKRLAVRVRIADGEAWLTLKGARMHGATPEFEYAIPVADADNLLRLATGPLIEKTRHWVTDAGKTWEIDEFHGDNQGLILAEIELQSLDEDVPAPSWLGHEVSDETRFYNASLTSHPFKDWNEAEKR